MWKPFRFGCLLGAGLLALPLVGAQTTPARAGVIACFEALSPQKAIEVAKKAGEASACVSEASSDPLMALTIAAMTSGAVGGLFSTIDECKARVNGPVGQLIAEALSTLPNPPLPDYAKNLLQAERRERESCRFRSQTSSLRSIPC